MTIGVPPFIIFQISEMDPLLRQISHSYFTCKTYHIKVKQCFDSATKE
jgi:hypothetical protein